MPEGYTKVADNIPNPNPIEGYEDCQTRWTDGDTCKVWEDGSLYEKPAVNATQETSVNWVRNLDKVP